MESSSTLIRVLLIESDEIAVASFRRVVKDLSLPIELYFVPNGSAALHMLAQFSEQLDLVVTGVKVHMDEGYPLFHILSAASHRRQIPIVVLSHFDPQTANLLSEGFVPAAHIVKTTVRADIKNIYSFSQELAQQSQRVCG